MLYSKNENLKKQKTELRINIKKKILSFELWFFAFRFKFLA